MVTDSSPRRQPSAVSADVGTSDVSLHPAVKPTSNTPDSTVKRNASLPNRHLRGGQNVGNRTGPRPRKEPRRGKSNEGFLYTPEGGLPPMSYVCRCRLD